MAAPLPEHDSLVASSCTSTSTTLPRNSTDPVAQPHDRSAKDYADKEESELIGDRPTDAAMTTSVKADRQLHQYAAMDPLSAEHQRRIRQLERDVKSTKIKSVRNSNTGMFKAMCSTDLLFLIDTTASMMGHINAAKTQVRKIIDAVIDAFFGDAEIRIAVVGYKVSRTLHKRAMGAVEGTTPIKHFTILERNHTH